MSIKTEIEAVDDIFQEGKVVDGFVLGKEVHRGGMASLFSATKEGIDIPILLKIPRVGRDQPVESLIGFETELTILRSLKSPHVPKYLGSGNMATRPYIAMERVEGRPLEDYIKEAKKLNANVDFYSGLVYNALGIERTLFTPIFAVSRVSGWIAHILEQLGDNRLIRPKADYVGAAPRGFIALDQRSSE